MKYLFLLLSFFYAAIAFSQSRYMIPYRDGNLWGYTDTTMKIIVAPKYDVAEMFWRGYGLVMKKKEFGYIDTRGHEIIKPWYDTFSEFSGDYFVAAKNGKAGIIQKQSGKIVLPVTYRNIHGFYGNTFKIENDNLARGLFNAATGKWLLAAEYEDISSYWFSDSVQYYIAKGKSKTIYFFFSKNDERISIVKPGTIEVIESEIAKSKYPVLPATSQEPPPLEIVLANDYTKYESFTTDGKKGYYRVTVKDTVKTIDTIPALYSEIKFIKDDYQNLIVQKNGKEGIIDWHNKQLMPLLYDEISTTDSTINNGIYIVRMNGKYGLANTDKLLLPCKYDAITNGYNSIPGFALRLNNKQGAFIFDRQKFLLGVLIEAEYDYLLSLVVLQPANFSSPAVYEPFYKKEMFLVLVSKNNKRGYVDLKGKDFFRN